MSSKATKGIGSMVLILAVLTLSLSYWALSGLAADNGLNDWRQYVWPITIDIGLGIFMLVALWFELQGEPRRFARGLVWVASIGTIVFNVAHAPPNTMARIVAAVPPVLLFASFELLVMMLKEQILRDQAVESRAAIKADTEHLFQQKTATEGQINALQAKIEATRAELKELRKEKHNYDFYVSEETIERARDIMAERSDINGSELGRELGRSARLGRRLIKQLQPELPHTNGISHR